MKPEPLIFGIDGGGTSTRLLAVKADPLLESIEAGAEPVFIPVASVLGDGANVNALGDAILERNLRNLFESLRASLGEAPSFIAGGIGAAGAGRPGERSRVERALGAASGAACPIVAAADHEIALFGGLRSRSGFLLLSGTGSIAYARTETGDSFRAGGLGHWLGDEGSAFDVSFRAISRYLRSLEGRDLPCGFGSDLLRHFGLKLPVELVPFVYGSFDKAVIAGIAPLIADYRDRGDALASDIYGRAADELVDLLHSVWARAAGSVIDRRVLFWGGMLERDRWLRERVSAGIISKGIDLSPAARLGSAAEGACLLAANLLRKS